LESQGFNPRPTPPLVIEPAQIQELFGVLAEEISNTA
jgi:hypothetical protein